MYNKVLFIDIPHVYPSVAILFNNEEILNELMIMYSPYANLYLTKKLGDISKSCIISIDKLGDMYKINFNGISEYEVDFNKIIEIIEIFLHKVLYTENEYLFLHGAALSLNKTGFLILGGTGSGKTTLTTYLLQDEFKYITDDKIIVNAVNGKICLFNRPIQLRKGGKSVLSEKYGYNLKLKEKVYTNKDERYLLDVNDNVSDNYLCVRKIFIINRSTNGDATCFKIDKESAFNSIISNLYSSAKIKQNVEHIIELIKNTDIYCLKYSKMCDAKKYIWKIISENLL